MKKKAQAAMEFLMTYGWAILVVLIAIGALAYFGVLNPERFVQDRCVITPIQLKCEDYNAVEASGTTTVTFRIKNDLPDDITIDTINIVDTGTGVSCSEASPGTSILSEENADVTVTCTGLSSGDKLKGNIKIGYTPTGGLSKAAAGQLVVTIA